MSGSTPPPALEPTKEASSDNVDSGWSTAPPPASIQNGLQRVAPRGRADGTLLGVAPPSEALTVPEGRSAVVVHAGIAPPAAMSRSMAHPEARQIDALPVPVAPPVRPQPPAPLAPFVSASVEPAALVTDQIRNGPASFREPPPVLSAPVAPAAVWRRPEPALLGFGDAMKLRVRFAGAERPLWTILAPCLGVLVVGVALVAVAGTWRFGASRSVEKSGVNPAVSAAVEAAPVAPGAPDQAADEADLKKKPPESLSADDVLMLATIAAQKKDQTAQRFLENLARDPSTLKDKTTLPELRKLIADPDTAREALAASARLPGPISADLLYEVWTGTPNRTDTSELARALVSTREVHAKTSEALAVALDLRTAQTCADNQAILQRAVNVGDRRALPLLLKLQRKQGCGATKKQDCFMCLREGGELDAAIAAVKARRSPNPFAAR